MNEDAHRLAFHHVVVIVNPVAGRGLGMRLVPRLEHLVREAIAATTQACEVRVALTSVTTDAESLAREAVAHGADLVVAAGGDGTLNGVVNAVAGTSVGIAQIPLGTGNDFARALGVPRSPHEAVRLLRDGRIAQMDVGVADGRRFLNVAGCGFDAAVAEQMNRRRRWLSGTPAYVLTVLATLARYRPVPMRIRVDETTIETPAMLCAVANGTGYGGGMRIAPEARWDDGLLDVCVVKAVGKLEFLRAFPRVFRGNHTTHPKVIMLRGKTVHVESAWPVPALLDGELAGNTPVQFAVEPRALRFVVPLR